MELSNRVLGVDPGLTRCGIAVIDADSHRRVRFVAAGVVRTPADSDLASRLCVIQDGMVEYLAEFQPAAVAIERVFTQHNVRSAMGTAQAAAVCMVAASRRNLPVAQHTPSEVKAAVTGSGTADKRQVGQMVQRLLRLAELPRPADAADALALAICHAWRAPLTRRLERRSAVVGTGAHERVHP